MASLDPVAGAKTPILAVDHLSMRFGGLIAVNDVSFVAARGEVTAVYVLIDGRLSLRQVRLGDAAGDQVDVISGLKPGERIATDPVAAQQALVAARKDG